MTAVFQNLWGLDLFRTEMCVLSRFRAILCDPMDCSPPGASVHGISQARIPEWLACPLPRDLPDPGTEPWSPVAPALQAGSLPLSHLNIVCKALFLKEPAF